MKTISNAVLTLLGRMGTETFVLIEIKSSPIIRITTSQFDIVLSNISGAETYAADGPIVAIDPPRLTSIVDREAYKITLADADGTLRALFNAGIVGTAVSVRFGFINNGPPVVDSAGNSVGTGAPLLDYRDTIMVYSGAIDTTNITADFNENTNTATIECSSPMGALDMRKAFFTSKDSMRNKNAEDTSFDFVHVSSGAATLLWGKS